MATRPTFININEANAEIRDMEAHMQIMKRMISVQSERIDNLKAIIEVYKKQIESHKDLRDNHITLMVLWLDKLNNNEVGKVMESIDRTIGINKETK